MKRPANSDVTGGRLTGDDMREYMEGYSDKYLKGKIRYNTEILKLRREVFVGENSWAIETRDTQTGALATLRYSKIVLCTGVCLSIVT
jgi:dimethylaniline monooxygenase (N-oxide forming)